jgi:hypothetical protein
MGNQSSSETTTASQENDVTLPEAIDTIATKYILTQNFQDMLKIENKEYCDKLIILTSKIFGTHLTNLELKYLAQRTEKGVIIDKMSKDNVTYLDKSKADHIDVQNDVQKRRMCIGIAKFYVRIAHIFAAITKTLNPTYEYKNAFGETERASLLNKNSVPAGIEKKLVQTNICSQRFNAIKSEIDEASKTMTITPKFCDMNKGSSDKTKSLMDEPGIPELRELYNDVYDYNVGKYVGMSPAATEKYKSDLASFYKAFTGAAEVPSEVTTFSSIPLVQFHKSVFCMKKPEPMAANDPDAEKYAQFTQPITGPSDNKMFQEYGVHTAEMLKTAKANQSKLLGVIDKLFIFRVNPKTKEREISVHPDLTDDKLEQITEETRNLIISLYIKCEQDFQKGLTMFEGIITEQMRLTAQRRINELEKQKEKLVAALPPVAAAPQQSH